MIFRISVVIFAMAFVLAAASSASAQATSGSEVDDIKRTLDEQEQTIRQLKERVAELEDEEAATEEKVESLPAVSEEPPEAPNPFESEEPIAPGEEAMKEIRAGRRAPVIYRGALNDRQIAAARAGDYTIDPDYRGFIPIPNTVGLIKFNAIPRADFIGDSGDPGTEFRFVPSQFPASSQKGWRFSANSNASQLRVEVVAPTLEGNFRFFYQNDFFGSNSNPMNYRLQHLYAEYYGVLAGFTFGAFEDPDAWPDTVDYEGPNSVVFARRAVGQYLTNLGDDWELMLSIEDPDHYVDTTGDPGADDKSRIPDTGFALRWAPGDRGHVRVAAMIRSIAVDGDDFSDDDVFGWGINTSGNWQILDQTNVQWWFVYGWGIGGLGNDTSFVDSDAAFNDGGNLRPLEYVSTMIAVTHRWTPKWRTTVTHGFVDLANTDQQAGDAYKETHYASVNLVYQLFKRLSIGLEGLYGHSEVNDGRDNDLFRIQLGLRLSLFD